ncbi:MAG TPA: DUF3293 domain-containing protein [Burkholderiales bacterium]|nr:DUF3293 domain-containing protein [Burkholderiales bacterium]
MPISPEQLDAYTKADYVVFSDRQVVLRVGKKNDQLDELINAEGAKTAAFVTAANPRGDKRSEKENGVANAALQSFVQAAGYPHFWGEGRDPFGSWAEPSFLVIGIYRANAEALGQLFEQNAIVFCEIGRPPELIILRGEP